MKVILRNSNLVFSHIKKLEWEDISNQVVWVDGRGISTVDGQNYETGLNSFTEFFNIKDYEKIILTMNRSTTDPVFGIAFYSEDRQFISGIKGYTHQSEKSYIEREIDVPENTVFFRTTFYTEFKDNFVCKIAKIIE